MTMTVEVRPAGVVAFIRHRPLTSFFLWLFTVGQAFAFAPVVVLWTTGVQLPYWQVFVLGSTLVGMLLPAVVITRIVDGPEAVRELWRRAFAVGVPLRWYALAFLAAPLLAIALAVLVVGAPDAASQIVTALVSGLLLQLVLTFVPNNWWEEVAWSGFAQARLQERFGSAAKAALVAGPLFALQHVSLAVAAGWPTGAVMMGLLILVTVPFRFLTGWAYNRTGSLFLVGLVHAMGNAVAGGSGFGAGFLPRLYPDQGMLVGLMHLLAFAADRSRRPRRHPRPARPAHSEAVR